MIDPSNSAVQKPQRLPVQPTGELSPEAAEGIALTARAEFGATAETEGRRAALKTFNLRVSYWANQFTDKRLRRFAWTIGTAMLGETHTFAVSVERLRRLHQKLHPGAYLDKAAGKPRMLSKSQILRYLEDLEDAGVIEVIRERQDEGGDYPGAQKVNVYTVRFDRVIRDGAACAHDFMAADQRNDTKNDTRLDTRDDTQNATRDDTLTCSSTGSNTASRTASSSRDGDDAGASREDQEQDPSARVGGGTAQDDHPSPGNREDAQASSAAPPGGGAPAATATGQASRENRGELEAWAREMIADLNETMAAHSKPHINATRRFIHQMVSQVREQSADTVVQGIWWCLGGNSASHCHVADMDNPAGILTEHLPGIVSEYDAARKRQAVELGKDPATFNLHGWLRDQEGQEDSATAQAPGGDATGQECAEIRALMETIVPHAAVVMYHGRADGEEVVRREFCSGVGTSSSRWRTLSSDDLPGWQSKAMRLVKSFTRELPYAGEDDPAVITAREFCEELLSSHPWLAERIPAHA